MKTARSITLRAGTALVSMLVTLPAQGDEVSDVYSGRAGRRAAYRNDKVLAAVDSGLAWLKAHQDVDGRWSCANFMRHDPKDAPCTGPGNNVYDIGVTSLALLALLAQGDVLHNDACHQASDWLRRQFNDRTGSVPAQTHDFLYSQALATTAMAEAAAVLRGKRYRAAARGGINYLESHRTPGAAWRYMPRDADNDSSITSWCLAAYFSGQQIGIEVPAQSVGEAIAWLDRVTQFSTGLTGYTKAGESSSRHPGDHASRFPIEKGDALTAAGLHARLMAGLCPSHPLANLAATRLADKLPKWEPEAIDFYYWLQGSTAMSQLQGSKQHKRWRSALEKALLKNQCREGAALGSWDPVGVWCDDGGRVYATAASVLCLSSDYRLGAANSLAVIPTTSKFRRIQGLWRDGKIGEAATMLARLPDDKLSATERAKRRRTEWYVAVEVARTTTVLSSLDKIWPSFLERQQRLTELAATLNGLPVAQLIEDELQKLRNDPLAKDELAADKALRGLQKQYDKLLKSRVRSKRRKMHDKLRAIADRYPKTVAGKRAAELSLRML